MIVGKINRIVGIARLRVLSINRYFNQLTRRRKRLTVFFFVASITTICILTIAQAVRNQGRQLPFESDQIVMPYDIFMNDERSVSENQLTPVGKMKGEVNGEFESFYVAVDFQGSVFINRDIEYAEDAYQKSHGWKQISREELMEYEKHLDFIPSRSRGIRR